MFVVYVLFQGRCFFRFLTNIGGVTVDINGTGIVGIGGNIGHGGKLNIGFPGGLGGDIHIITNHSPYHSSLV